MQFDYSRKRFLEQLNQVISFVSMQPLHLYSVVLLILTIFINASIYYCTFCAEINSCTSQKNIKSVIYKYDKTKRPLQYKHKKVHTAYCHEYIFNQRQNCSQQLFLLLVKFNKKLSNHYTHDIHKQVQKKNLKHTSG